MLLEIYRSIEEIDQGLFKQVLQSSFSKEEERQISSKYMLVKKFINLVKNDEVAYDDEIREQVYDYMLFSDKIGQYFEAAGQYTKAIEMYKTALIATEILVKHRTANHYDYVDLAVCNEVIGRVLLRHEQYEEALAYYANYFEQYKQAFNMILISNQEYEEFHERFQRRTLRIMERLAKTEEFPWEYYLHLHKILMDLLLHMSVIKMERTIAFELMFVFDFWYLVKSSSKPLFHTILGQLNASLAYLGEHEIDLDMLQTIDEILLFLAKLEDIDDSYKVSFMSFHRLIDRLIENQS